MTTTLRWIFGLPAAILLCLLVNWIWWTLFVPLFYNYAVQHPQVTLVVNTARTVIINVLLVFLSCWFIPSSKKYIGLGWIILVVGDGLCRHISNQVIHYGSIYIIQSLVAIAGLLLGFLWAYLQFKNNGWNTSRSTN